MKMPLTAIRQSRDERQELISDLFHALHQPLTTLQCSLEMAEHQTLTEEQYREMVRSTLEQVAKVAELISGLREWLEAEDPGENPKVLALGTYLQEAVEELLPVAQARGVKLSLRYRSLPSVSAEPRRLRHALFHFIEGAIEAAEEGSVVGLEATVQNGQAVISLTTSRKDLSSPADAEGNGSEVGRQHKMHFIWWRLALAIAARTFEAAGGKAKITSRGRRITVEVSLPLADGE